MAIRGNLTEASLPDVLAACKDESPAWQEIGTREALRANLAERHAGYKGRTGIYELVGVDDTMRRLIHEGASEADLDRHARSRSPSILEDGWHKCVSGVTSSEEVLRVTREE